MKAVIVEQPGSIVIRETELPKPGPYDALVHMGAGCLCNSTDGKLISGHFPGLTDYPIILGHEGIGKVVEVGSKVRVFREGQRVIGALNLNPVEKGLKSGWGTFAEYALVSDHQAMIEDGMADIEHGWQEVFRVMKPVPDTRYPVSPNCASRNWVTSHHIIRISETFVKYHDFKIMKIRVYRTFGSCLGSVEVVFQIWP